MLSDVYSASETDCNFQAYVIGRPTPASSNHIPGPNPVSASLRCYTEYIFCDNHYFEFWLNGQFTTKDLAALTSGVKYGQSALFRMAYSGSSTVYDVDNMKCSTALGIGAGSLLPEFLDGLISLPFRVSLKLSL